MPDRLTAGPVEQDPASEWYGQPSNYRMQGEGGFYPPRTEVVIHPSRVVRFVGAPIQSMFWTASTEWGDSVLQAVRTAVLQALSVATNTADLTHEAKIDVLGVKDLMQMASNPDYEARFQKRASLAMLSKSMHSTLIHDSEEEYSQKQVSFQTMPDLIDRFFQIAAGAADIPATRLLGQSPAGLSATGESDLRNYYDRVGAGQELELRPAMSILDECLIWSATGKRDPDTHYVWAPLWQMSETDQADVTMKKAQAFKIDVDSGLIPDSAMSKARVNQLTEDGVYPGLDLAIKEAEAEGDAIDFGEKAEQAKAANDNPVPPEEEQLRAARASGRRFGDIASVVTDAEPRTLYVSRKVLNAADIVAWAKSQGFETTLSIDDLHVTICYSRTPLDWMKIEPDWGSDEMGQIVVAPGGPRLVEKFGDAVVLLFSHWKLMSRHSEFMRAGASHDFDDYQPHVTITYEPDDVDLNKVEPYQGKIVLGPEIFAEVKKDWRAETEEA